MSWAWLLDNAGEIAVGVAAVVGIWRSKGKTSRKILDTARELDHAARELKLYRAEKVFRDGMDDLRREAETVPDFVEEMQRKLSKAGL